MEKYLKCAFCGQYFKRGDWHHTHVCRKNYEENLSEEKKSEIIGKYKDEGYSMVDMSKYLGLPYSATERILRDLGCERRTVKDASKIPRKKEKYENTCLEHFGYKHNFFKGTPSRKKWENKLLTEEGITNVFQRKEVIEKIRNTMIERYGEEEWKYQRSKSSDVSYYIEKYGEEKGREEWERVCYEKGKSGRPEYYIEKYGKEDGLIKWEEHFKNHNFTHNDGLNEKCADMLEKNGIKDYEREFKILTAKRYYSYDFKINNLLIELNGTYWHCSPKRYKPNDLVKFPNNRFIKAKDKWEYDKKKCNFAREKGFIVETIWEDEFTEDLLLTILEKNNYGKDCKN